MDSKRKIKNQLLVIGFSLLLVGFSIIIFNLIYNKHINKIEEFAINDYYLNEHKINKQKITNQSEIKEEKYNYIAVLKVPKISLERGLVDPESKYNDIKYNVQILSESDMPDKENGNVILAAHSGNSRVSFFKNLDKISIGDSIIIDYNNYEYKYSVVNIYDVEKKGNANIIRNKNVNTLTLITCRHNTKKQIVIICESED